MITKNAFVFQMVSVVVMLMLIGVALGAAPSYHQERPTREQLAQWEAALGIAGIVSRFPGEDPELENVVDPSLLNEIQPARAARDVEPFTDCSHGPCVTNHPLFKK